MRGAVRELRDYYENKYSDEFKRKHDYKNLTGKRKEEFKTFLNEQEMIKLCDLMLEELEKYYN